MQVNHYNQYATTVFKAPQVSVIHEEIFVLYFPSSQLSEVVPSLKRVFQLGFSADPAVSRDVPAPLNSFNRIGPSPQQ